MRPTESPHRPPLLWPALLPGGGRSDWGAIHRAHARRTWRSAAGASAKLALLWQAIRWPFLSVETARQLTRKCGGAVKRHTGKSKKRQLREQIRLAFGQCIAPRYYYRFQLFLPENGRRAQRYLHGYEIREPVRRKSPAYRDGRRQVEDKALFHRRCVERGIPTAPVHLAIGGASPTASSAQASLPPEDLIVKPVWANRGAGVEGWRYGGDGTWQNAVVGRRDADGLLEHLVRTAPACGLLVQSWLPNHPDLLDLCGGVLSTARVMTVLDERLAPEVTDAAFRIAVRHAVADNHHLGGLAAGVDLRTGTLGAARALSSRKMRVEVHPHTGAKIRGRRLPDWDAAVELARRAHEAMPGLLTVGWDVGFTAEGPVLVEGNDTPSLYILQIAAGGPLGGTRFGQLVAFHLASSASSAGG